MKSGKTCRIWLVRLDQDAEAADTASLSAEERARAARFHFERDRVHFTRCRAALRALLGEVLKLPPRDVPLATGTHKKPILAAPYTDAIAFNVSHSGERALIALGRVDSVGVDIEVLRDMHDVPALAKRTMQVSEHGFLELPPGAEQTKGFLTCWTRKEAVLKCLGTGLYLEPITFAAGCTPESREITVSLDDRRHELSLWSFVPEEGYIAACALPSPAASVEYLRFDAHSGLTH